MAEKKPKNFSSTDAAAQVVHRLPRLKVSFKTIILRTSIIVGVLILIIGLVAWWFLVHDYNHEYYWARLTHSRPIVFKVGTTAYDRPAVDHLAAYLTQVAYQSTSQAARTVFDDLKIQAAAKAASVIPSDSEITSQLSELGYGQAVRQTYAYPALSAFALVAPLAARRQSQGQYSGYSFVFWFGQHLSKASPVGNAQLVAADRSYAEQQATHYHDLLKNQQITPGQALSDIRADTKLAMIFMVPGSNPSTQFGTASNPFWQQAVNLPSVVTFIKQQTKTGLSTIQIGQIPSASSQKPTDSYFYFVLLGRAQPAAGDIYTDFQHSLQSLKTKYYGI